MCLGASLFCIFVFMDELFYDAVDLLKAMITVKSVSREEKALADMLEEAMKGFGLEVKRIGNNVWSLSPDFDSSRPTVLLNSHIDTVKPTDRWTRNPLVAEVDEATGALYGLGSNDAGASVVSLLAAYRYLVAKSQACNFVFLASCEEEVSGRGGVEMALPQLPHIDVAVVGEPTSMQPAVAEKGLMVLDGIVKGVAGHAARNEGVNAIYNAVEVIERLRNVRFERESPTLGPIKISVTQINAGTQHNVVPDSCRIVVDVRTTEVMSNAATLKVLQDVAGDLCTFEPRSLRLNPSSIDEKHPLVQRLKMLGKKPFGSPTLSDQALMSFPSVKIGPGDSSRSHTADEYIFLEEIREAIHTYISLLDGCRL